MKNNRMLTTLIVYSIIVIFSSCKNENISEPQASHNSSNRELTITARTSPLYKSLPPWPISIRLLRANGVQYDTIATAVTNTNGECTFSNLPQGSYVGEGIADAHYPAVSSSNFVYLLSDVVQGRAMLYHLPRYHLGPDTIVVCIDTTIVIDRVFSTFIMNDGAQDTLHCAFDTSQVPAWCAVTFTTNMFIPQYFGTSMDNFKIELKASSFPWHSLPININIPFSTQFDNDTLLVRFVHQKLP